MYKINDGFATRNFVVGLRQKTLISRIRLEFSKRLFEAFFPEPKLFRRVSITINAIHIIKFDANLERNMYLLHLGRGMVCHSKR